MDRPLLDRPARIAGALAILLAVAGAVLLATTTGATAIIGGGLIAVAATIGTSLAYYAVGRSEDRDRARGSA